MTRALSGYEKLAEDPRLAQPQNITLNRMRNLFRFLPIHRLFHSIEQTIIYLLAAIIQYFFVTGFERNVLQLLTLLAAVVVVGHTVAILNSSRLKK